LEVFQIINHFYTFLEISNKLFKMPKKDKKVKAKEPVAENPKTKDDDKKIKKKRKSTKSYSSYISKKLKDMSPDFGLASATKAAIDGLLSTLQNQMFEEAENVAKNNGKRTISDKEMKLASNIVIKDPTLSDKLHRKAQAAVEKYVASKPKVAKSKTSKKKTASTTA
jgi:histone H3/H4